MPEIEAIAAASQTRDRSPPTDFFKKASAPAAQTEHRRTEKAVDHEAIANHEGIIDRQKEGGNQQEGEEKQYAIATMAGTSFFRLSLSNFCVDGHKRARTAQGKAEKPRVEAIIHASRIHTRFVKEQQSDIGENRNQ